MSQVVFLELRDDSGHHEVAVLNGFPTDEWLKNRLIQFSGLTLEYLEEDFGPFKVDSNLTYVMAQFGCELVAYCELYMVQDVPVRKAQ